MNILKFIFIIFTVFFHSFSFSYELSPAQKKNLQLKIQLAKKIASNPIIINEVIKSNHTPLIGYENMTEEEWFKLQYIHHKVRYFYNTEAAKIMREQKDISMTEMFINNMHGTKVAFLAKTSTWNHSKKPKHLEPMKNKVWIGEVEKDQSSGTLQIQISVPVLNKDIPIGSMIVGLSVDRLK